MGGNRILCAEHGWQLDQLPARAAPRQSLSGGFDRQRIKLGQNRARTGGQHIGRPPTLILEQGKQCLGVPGEGEITAPGLGDDLLAGDGVEDVGR